MTGIPIYIVITISVNNVSDNIIFILKIYNWPRKWLTIYRFQDFHIFFIVYIYRMQLLLLYLHYNDNNYKSGVLNYFTV